MLNRIGCSAAMAVLWFGTTAYAGAPKLQRLSLHAIQRGTTAEVELRGMFFHNPQDILFYEPGVTVESMVAV
ncbi:MAG: hypothetical protein ACO1RT_08055, partial [Planctomycetaceae bacterium]